jgi:hypothetical protein
MLTPGTNKIVSLVTGTYSMSRLCRTTGTHASRQVTQLQLKLLSGIPRQPIGIRTETT